MKTVYVTVHNYYIDGEWKGYAVSGVFKSEKIALRNSKNSAQQFSGKTVDNTGKQITVEWKPSVVAIPFVESTK